MEWVLRYLRPEDLLNLSVRLTNLRVSSDGASLEREDPGQPALLTVELPPQHVAERAYFRFARSSERAGPVPVESIAAGPSRLVFALPDDVGSLPLTVTGLLDWGALQPRLAPAALPRGATSGPRPAPPGPEHTAIEFPYRLMLSPIGEGGWLHEGTPVEAGGHTELWHTRLVPVQDGRPDGLAERPVPLRALHARQTPDPIVPSSMSLADLDDLVTLTADFANRPRQPRNPRDLWHWAATMARLRLRGPVVPPPKPLEGEQVMLTALGASMRLRGDFDFPRADQAADDLRAVGLTVPSLVKYVHIAGLGRDQYVEVVRRGFVDTGHRAVIIRVTARQFEPRQIGTREGPHGTYAVFGATAYLRQYYRVLIQQPVLDYARLGGGYAHGGREMPLRSIELTTLSTPDLDLPLDVELVTRHITHEYDDPVASRQEIHARVQQELERAFDTPLWLQAGHQDVSFDFIGTDWRQRRISSTRPLMFIPDQRAGDADAVITAFAEGPASRRRAVLGGQVMALAEPHDDRRESTSTPAQLLRFTLDRRGNGSVPQDYVPSWMFRVADADAVIEPLQRLTGMAAAHRVELTTAYLDAGLDPGANPTGSFARLVDGAARLAMGAREGGGLSAPDLDLDTLSDRAGLISQQLTGGSAAGNALAPFFGDMRLFGTIPLTRLLGPIPAATAEVYGRAELASEELERLLADPQAHVEVPIVRSRAIQGPDGVPVAVETRFLWKPVLQVDPGLKPAFELADAQLVLDVITVAPLDGSPPDVAVRGRFTGFAMVFAGVARLGFGTLAFTALPGRKPDVTADGVSLDFIGALEFVNTLRDLLPMDGFSDPPAITVDEVGIQAGFSLAIPSVGVGVFSLQDLALSSVLSVPFIGKAAGLRFALSERHRPFLVTVTMFGGGGFFALGVSANGVEEIEAAIEFGGNVSLNLGVASGGVHVMAGVYFGMTVQVTQLTGYLRCGGYLSVLGLISVSLEFYLAFTWRDKGGGRSEVWGQASLSVAVSVAFFSASVTLSVERRFAGASGDPTLDQVMDEDDWQQYCLAYAQE